MVDSDNLPFVGKKQRDESESRVLELVSKCSGTVEGRTKLMKLIFFSEYYDPESDSLQPEERMGVFDDFIIYNHGPFSRDLMDVFDSLKEEGLIEEETELTFRGNRRKVIHLTDEGWDEVEEMDSEEGVISDICKTFGKESASTLEDLCLEMLGLNCEEKDQYRFTPVSKIIAE
jgi:uncharacterized protein YwgA